MNADMSGNAMPGNVSTGQIRRSLSPPFLEHWDREITKLFSYEAKCLNLTLDCCMLQVIYFCRLQATRNRERMCNLKIIYSVFSVSF